MVHFDVDSSRLVTDRRVRPSAGQGLATFATAATLDAFSTVLGLAFAPVLHEQNPFARALFDVVGVFPAVLVCSAIAAIVVFAVTELAVQAVDPTTTDAVRDASIVRVVGYGVPSLVTALVASNNLALLARHGFGIP